MATIFISYCQKDKDWLEMVETRLRIIVFNMDGAVELGIWDDQQLDAGDDWEPRLTAALEGATIAVLLVSNRFLASRFVRTRELPYLQRRHDQHDGLIVIPVICERCPWMEDSFLSRLQAVAADAGLRGADPYHQDLALTALYERVSEIVRQKLPEVAIQPPERGTSTADGSEKKATKEEPEGLPPPAETLKTLEFRLGHYNGDDYRVLIRFVDPDNADNFREHAYKTRMEPPGLKWRTLPTKELPQRLLAEVAPEGPPSAMLVHAAQVAAEADHAPMRLRIGIEPNASELHQVPWEVLVQAERLTDLFGASSILFSRHAVATHEAWPPPIIHAFPRRMSVKLLASASPSQQARTKLLQDRFETSVAADIQPTGADNLLSLSAIHAPVVLLLPDLVREYRDCELRFVGHDGQAHHEAMDDLAERLAQQHTPQQVLILDSGSPPKGDDADEAGRETLGGQLARLASELIATGPCAVVTWQAPIGEAAWLDFLTHFLNELATTGNVLTAERTARARLGGNDAWRPLVLHRLRTGQIWYRPTVHVQMRRRWRLIEERIGSGAVIPIIGPQISDYFMRSRRQIARVLASQCRFPLAPCERCNLQKVAQYTETTEERRTLERRFMLAARDYAARRLALDLPVPVNEAATRAALDVVWRRLRDNDGAEEPLGLLAKLRCPLYLTTNFHDYLSRALAAEIGLEQQQVRDRIWTLADRRGILRGDEDADEAHFELSRDAPEVHYLFGRWDYSHSLALTEDDYFRFLLGFKDRWKSLPRHLVQAFNDSALLFLGFDLEDWDFRVLFRALLELENSALMRDIPHVAVQITPDDDHLSDPERTYRYLLDYFGQISDKPVIFVGSARDFLLQIHGQDRSREVAP